MRIRANRIGVTISQQQPHRPRLQNMKFFLNRLKNCTIYFNNDLIEMGGLYTEIYKVNLETSNFENY